MHQAASVVLSIKQEVITLYWKILENFVKKFELYMLKVSENFLNLTIGSCNEIRKNSSCFWFQFNLTNLDDIFVISLEWGENAQ